MTFIRQCFFLVLCAAAVFFSFYEIKHARSADDFIYTPWLEKDWPFVVELFTSTDCPGCGLSDSILYKLADDKNVIAFSCHVSYLENPDNPDKNGMDECTNRQWFYSSARWTGRADLYTPQWVVNGKTMFEGLNRVRIYEQLRIGSQYSARPEWVTLERAGPKTMLLHLPDGSKLDMAAGRSHGIWLIRYQDSRITKVPKSEANPTPRVVRYTNVLTGVKHVGKWYAKSKDITVDLNIFPADIENDPGGWIALVQRTNGDEISAAGKLVDPALAPAPEKTP